VAQGVVGAFAVLSIGVWAQSDRSVNTIVWSLFALGIGLPILGLLGLVGDAARRGRFRLTPAVPLVVVSILLLLGSVVAGLLWSLNLAGSGTLFGLDVRLLGAAQVTFVGASVVTGVLAALFHWAPQFWGGPVRSGPAYAAAGLTILGGGLLATVVLVQGIVQRDGVRTANEVFGVFVILASLAYLLGVLSALSAVRGAAADPSGDDEIVQGETLEWALPTPAHGDRIPDDLPAVESPYPLAADDPTTEVAR
jgi:MFS family permease